MVSIPKRKRSNVEKQHVLDFAAEHAALNSRADCNAFVGVDALERFFAALLFLRRRLRREHGSSRRRE